MENNRGCGGVVVAIAVVLMLVCVGFFIILFYGGELPSLSDVKITLPDLSQLLAQLQGLVQPAPTVSNEPASASSAATWSIGQSNDGRPIEVHRWGNGDKGFAVVGGIHGQYESNTIELANQLVDFFDSQPQPAIPAGVSLYIIPALNPDGLANGSRLNAREVDLNRNWDCEWEATAMYRDQPVSPGETAFSEPETRALRDFVASEGIDAVLFYHSAYGSVSVGVCSENTALAQDLGEEVAEATGYQLFRGGSFFPMTGDATGYFNQIGLAAIEIELTDHANVEWERNLDGILAALGWVAQRP